MEIISHTQEVDNDAIIFGEKDGQWKFRIIDNERQYDGIFDFKQTKDVRVQKINGAYIFSTPTAVYIYYKGAREIAKILEDVTVLKIVGTKIYFNDDGKSYFIDLLRKETK